MIPTKIITSPIEAKDIWRTKNQSHSEWTHIWLKVNRNPYSHSALVNISQRYRIENNMPEQQKKDNSSMMQNNATPSLLRRKPSVIGRWRQRRLKKNQKSNGDTYLSFSEILDSDYPFHISKLDDAPNRNHSTVRDCSLTEVLVRSANVDSFLSEIAVTCDSDYSTSEVKEEPTLKFTESGQITSSHSDYKSSYSSKAILRRMKSFRLNLRPKSFRTLAVLWSLQKCHVLFNDTMYIYYNSIYLINVTISQIDIIYWLK
jgi:hypothetical protein